MRQSPAVIKLALAASLLAFACAEFTPLPTYLNKDLHLYCHRKNASSGYGNSYDASNAFRFCLLKNAPAIKEGARLWSDYEAKLKVAIDDVSIRESHKILTANVESEYQKLLQVNSGENSYFLEMLYQMKDAKLREIGSLEEWAIKQRDLDKHAFRDLPSDIQWHFVSEYQVER